MELNLKNPTAYQGMPATKHKSGAVRFATADEVLDGIAQSVAVSPADLTSLMASPGEIGGTTPAPGTFTTLDAVDAGFESVVVEDDIIARTVFVDGDEGTGLASTVGFTNVTNTTQDSGALSIVSTTANSGDNAGFIKIYVGTNVAYIPYFTDIAP